MTLLDELRAFVRVRLIADVRTAWRLWSLRLITLGVIWQSLPPEVLALLPPPIGHWGGLLILVLAGVARLVQQDLSAETNDGR